MAKNQGKVGKMFEKELREQFQKIRNVSVDRITDNVRYKGAYSIADLIVYRKPYKYYIECKATSGTGYSFSSINKDALKDMVMASIIKGVDAYYIIWFIDLDLTLAINAREIYDKIYVEGRKSIGVSSFEDFEYIEVTGKKRRKFYDYNLTELLNNFAGEMR